jgi:hypothetical protein
MASPSDRTNDQEKNMWRNLRLLVTLFAMCAAMWAADAPLIPGSVVPAARGKVSFQHDTNGNIKFTVSAKRLGGPQHLTPAKSVYIVWIKPPKAEPQNAGVLTVNNNLEGSLSSTTPAKAFDVVVTAEDSPSVTHPTGPEILHGSVQAR